MGQNLTLTLFVGEEWERCYWFRYEDEAKIKDSHCSFDMDHNTMKYSLRRCRPSNMSSTMVPSGSDPKSCQITVPGVDETDNGVWAARLGIDREVVEVNVTVAEEMGEVELMVDELKAGVEATITCRVAGGNPPPSLSLTIDGGEEAHTTTSESVTTATLTFTPSREDQGKNVSCVAVQVDAQNADLYRKQQSEALNVLFAPQFDVNEDSYIEADLSSSVSLPLAIEANPAPDSVTWTVNSCGMPQSKKEHICLSTIDMGDQDGKYSASNITQSDTKGDGLLYLVNMAIDNVTEKDYIAKFEVTVTNTEGSKVHTFYIIPANQDGDITGNEVKETYAKVGVIAGVIVLVMGIILVLVILLIYRVKNKNSPEEQPLTSNKQQ